jgi:glycosyltransferase involved in cell wall biosynthesis
MKLLLLIRDPYPNQRPDIVTLFGERLRDWDIQSDLVAVRRGKDATVPYDWPAGRFLGIDGRIGSLLDAVRAAAHDIAMLRRAAEYDAVIVRDKIFAAAAALLIAPRGRVHYWMSFPFPEEDLIRARTSGTRTRRALLALRGRVGARLLYDWVVPRVSTVFVQSERMRERVAQRANRTEGLIAIPMGIDERSIPPLDVVTAPIDPGGTVHLGYLGVLDTARRLDFLLDVLVRLEKRSAVRYELLLIGDASTQDERRWLEREIAERGLTDRVAITGALARDEAWRRLSRCHIALSAIPRGELFDVSSPTKTVEYLALGLPAVVNDIPDQQWLIARTGAGMCVPMDIESFTTAIETVRADLEAFRERARSSRAWIVSERGYDQLAQRVAMRLNSRAQPTR